MHHFMILVAGSANLDFVVRAPRIPRPGETVLGRDFKTFPGGKGANQAVASARAGGVQTHLLAALGMDDFAKPIEASLADANVKLHAIRVADQPTGTAFICVSEDGENAITVAPGANLLLAPQHLPPLAGFSHLLLQLETPLASVIAYAATAREQGVVVVLNAAPAQALPADLLALVDILVVNEGELATIAGQSGTVSQNLARIAVPTVVVTLGSHGCCARHQGEFWMQPAFAITAVDSTAAGDTFCGVMVATLSQGADLCTAIRAASAAGALACTRLGAQSSIPMASEVAAFLAQQGTLDASLLDSLRQRCGLHDSKNKTQSPHKVIFDTDPGVDDAMALYFALAHPGIEVLGITTTFGNVSVAQAATNALYLCAIAHKPVTVTQGVNAPWVKPGEAPPDFIHGADGLGNLPSRVATHNQLDPRSSAQYIVDMARASPGEITLVAVGPLGNLALALKLEPQLPTLIREVIIMGGTVDEPGNVSPVAEANIWNDPHAADAVFTAGWKLTMVGLDVTHRVVAEMTLFKKIADHHHHVATDTLHHAVAFYSTFYSGMHSHLALSPGCFAHDVLAFIYLLNPEFFKLERGAVRVATEGIAQGQTMLNRRDFCDYPQQGWGRHMPSTDVCMQVDSAACIALLEQTLLSNWLNP
jgi:ribokinase